MTHDEKMEALELDAARNLVLLPDVRKVFAFLCVRATDWHEAANVNPVKLIASCCGYSKYRVRKIISCLRKLGLVERTTCGFPAYEVYTENGLTDWDEAHPPLNGFGLSEAGFQSSTYKLAEELLNKELAEWATMSDEEIERRADNG